MFKEISFNSSILKRQNFLILTLILLHSILSLDAQQDWKLKSDKEGIKIYTKPFPDSRIKALKVVCTLETKLSQMAAVLLDVKAQDEWFFNTKSSLLRQVSPLDVFYYGEIALPWPCSNRDFIAHLILSQNPITKTLTMEVFNVPDLVSPKRGVVRVMHSYGKWVVTPIGENLIMIEFTLFADPGGSLPYWLVNIFSSLGPFDSFKKLKAQFKKPGYTNIYFPSITD